MERLFSDLIAGHARGITNLRLTQVIREAIKAALKHNKKSEVTLKIGFSPEKGRLIVSFAEASKLPAEEPDRMMYFVDDDGNPVEQNPHQTALDLKELGG
jgi:hypothetical protein